MRKFILFLMAISLLVSLTVSAWAADEALSMTDTAVTAGQTIYLGVTLNQSLIADAMGVRYSYDSAILEPLPDSSVWDISGLLSNFNREDSGVWASTEPKDLKGKLFTLAFRLKDGVTLTETTVSCTVVFKNGNGNSQELTATGRVYTECDHSFGAWSNDGQMAHSRKCTLCGKNQSESHTWNSGVRTDHPTNPSLEILTKTCTQCGATRSVDVNAEATPELPTAPSQPTSPTEPPPTLPPLETIPPQTLPTVVPTTPSHSFGTPDPESPNPGTIVTEPTAPIRPTAPTEPTQPTEATRPTQPVQPTQPTQPTQPAPGHNVTDFNQSGGNTQNNTAKPTEPTAGNTGSTGTTPTTPGTGGPQTETRQPEETVADVPAHDHDHSSGENNNRIPVAVPIPSEHPAFNETQPDHDHEHPTVTEPVSGEAPVIEETESEAYLSSGLALLAATAAIAAAAALTVLLVRRTRKSK